MDDKDVITESAIITDPPANWSKKPVNWRMIIATVALCLLFVGANYLSYHLGYVRCQMDNLSRSITEMTEKADPLLEQAAEEADPDRGGQE